MKDEVFPFKAHWLFLTFNKTDNTRIKVTMRSVRVNIVAVEKHCVFTYSEFEFIYLVIRHEVRMRHIVICGLYGSTIFFFTLSHKRHNIREINLLNTKCVFSKSSTNLSETFFILRTIQRYIRPVNVHRASCKVPVVLVTH